MKPHFTTIETHQPLTHCLKTRISQSAWNDGIQTFFIDQVPFSFGTGQQFATLISDFLCEISPHYFKNDTLKIVELGAGLGLLSQKLYKTLQSSTLTQNLNITCTDTSKQLVDHYQTQNTAISFKQLNLQEWKNPEPADVFILSYVFDSLPCFRFKWENNTLFSLSISTHIPDNEIFINTSVFPPKTLNVDDICQYINKNKLDNIPLNRQISDKLSETYEWIEIEKDPHLSPEQIQEVIQFVKWASLKKEGAFNYFFNLENILNMLSQSFIEKGIAIIHDFGFNTPTSIWTSSFGCIDAQAMFFTQLQHVAEKTPLNLCLSNYPNSQSQIGILYHHTPDPQLEKAFQKIINAYPYGTLEKTITNIQKAATQPLTTQIIDQHLKLLAPTEKSDYFLLTNITLLLIEQKQYDLALHYANLSLNGHEPIALASYHLISIIYYHQGKLDLADQALEKGLRLAPHYPYFHLEKIKICNATQNYDPLIQHTRIGSQALPLIDQIPYYENLLLALIHQQKTISLPGIISFLNQIYNHFPTYSSSPGFQKIWNTITKNKN